MGVDMAEDRMKNSLSDVLRLTFCAIAFATVAEAQQQQPTTATVRGTVTDAVTGRPIVGAIVRLGPLGGEAATRTDEAGQFSFAGVRTGNWPFDVRRIGYEVVRRRLDVTTTITPLDIRLTRFATLDTVQVRAAKQGIFGVVGRSKDLTPLPNAKLTLVGMGSKRVDIDSTGHFFVPVKVIGAYVLRAVAPGHEAQTISMIVSPSDAVELAFLLDTAPKGRSYKIDVAFQDFESRAKQRGQLSAVIPRSELLKVGGKSDLTNAITYSPSFIKGNMRMGAEVCVYLDGMPRPILALNSYEPDQVEAIEAFGSNRRHSDRTHTLEDSWPRNAPCSTTGRPPVSPGDDVVKWVAIWLKH